MVVVAEAAEAHSLVAAAAMMKVSSLTIAVALCAVFLICNAAEEAADKRGAGTRTFAFAKRPSFAFAKRFPSR
uniref:Uncharacterized protein n=1 Tax=Plectus sambesii TaxID=2011161 RepID=A0A914WKA0_9BILA